MANIFPIIKTERLILRKITNYDLESIYRIYSDPKVAEYDNFSPIKSLETAQKIINNYNKEFEEGEGIRFALARKEDNLLIGTCGIGDFEDDSKRCEIGYDLLTSEWNKGYMTEAIKAITVFGFNNYDLNRIEAFITPGNDGSVKVLEKNGYIKEGIVRERDFFKGQFWDGIIMAILRKDFEKRYK